MNDETWSPTALSRVASKIGSGATPRGGKDSYQAEGISLIRSLNVYNFKFERNALAFIDDAQAAQLKNVKVQSGDILLNITGASVARCCMVPESVLPARVNQHVAILRVDETKAHNKFVYYSINSPHYKHHLLALAQGGATREALTKQTIENFEILLPKLSTQYCIATILSVYDDLIENNTRRIAILEEMARRLYEEWFIRFRFPGHENVRMVESDLGLVPEGWDIVSSSKCIQINPITKVKKDGLKSFLSMNCLANNSMLIENIGKRDGNSGSKFRNGDTLFARITPCLENGKTGFVQFLPNDEVSAFGSTEFIVLRSRTLTPELVYLLARSDAFRENAIKSMSGASGRQRVREACFNTFYLANPDQETLIKFGEIVRPMFKLAHSLSQKNLNLRTTRDLLLPKLISGEIDVSSLPEPEAVAP